MINSFCSLKILTTNTINHGKKKKKGIKPVQKKDHDAFFTGTCDNLWLESAYESQGRIVHSYPLFPSVKANPVDYHWSFYRCYETVLNSSGDCVLILADLFHVFWGLLLPLKYGANILLFKSILKEKECGNILSREHWKEWNHLAVYSFKML